MNDDAETLTEREKETLRLLASGHDAKSVATHVGLSVHTVNERLRTARRKLGVSSSRAAARWLIEAEHNDPKFSGDKNLGEATGVAGVETSRRTATRRGGLWILGLGGLLMFAIAAAALFISLTGTGSPAPVPSQAAAAATQAVTPDVAEGAATWLALLDNGAWAESWQAGGAMFRSQVTEADWVTAVRSAREPIGAFVSRTPQSAERTNSLPGAPDGEYWMVQYQTAFANRQDATETVVLAREGGDLKVIGYFVR
ncbi:DUF4019 domain-containing protein [Brevundimonas sp.]|uniref:DUF4019 domain-containing protein n=1 Tax=Brevundimonas sp. TaxID=1871086 RepID=UPI0028A24CC4|nr:DUF4019 domain-containing protein [Brevundimonas sp.]